MPSKLPIAPKDTVIVCGVAPLFKTMVATPVVVSSENDEGAVALFVAFAYRLGAPEVAPESLKVISNEPRAFPS